MGYTIRNSKTKAIFMNGSTYIIENNKYIALKKGNENEIGELRKLYFEENTSDKIIDYGKIYFSMNSGDYKKPIM